MDLGKSIPFLMGLNITFLLSVQRVITLGIHFRLWRWILWTYLLSEERLPDETTVHIDAKPSFSKLVEKKRFVISEGDWEDYYAARIEVWHRDAKTGDERKVMEKVYRVEGYMR